MGITGLMKTAHAAESIGIDMEVGADGCVAVPHRARPGITYDWDRLYADKVDSTILRA